MGLWNWIRTQVTGVDVAAEQARSDAADKALADYNTSTGYYDRLDPAAADAARRQYESQVAAGQDLAGQVNDAAVEGAKQGLKNEANLVSDTLNGVGNFVWTAIPWWVWLLGLVALFLYAGGGVWLKGRLAK